MTKTAEDYAEGLCKSICSPDMPGAVDTRIAVAAFTQAMEQARQEEREACAETAELQCLKSAATKRKTGRLGLKRLAYDTEFMREVGAAIRKRGEG